MLGDLLELGELPQAHAALWSFVPAAASTDGRVRAYSNPWPPPPCRRSDPAGAVRVHADKAAAQSDVLGRLAPGDVILVKASRGLALDTVAEAILAFGEDSA